MQIINYRRPIATLTPSSAFSLLPKPFQESHPPEHKTILKRHPWESQFLGSLSQNKFVFGLKIAKCLSKQIECMGIMYM
jgi:hypothetical protein